MQGDEKKQAKQAGPSEEELWRLAYRRLVLWTVKRHRLNAADAEEVVQEAIRQFLTAGGTAEGGLGELLKTLGSRINGIVVNRRRKKATSAILPTHDGLDPEQGDDGRVEEQLINNDWFRKAIGLLLERIEEDSMLLSMIMKMADGIRAPAQLAVELQVDVNDVYNANRRLGAHVAAVKASMEGS